MVFIHGDGYISCLEKVNLVKNRDLNGPLLPKIEDLKFPLILILFPAECLYDVEEMAQCLSQGSRAEYHQLRLSSSWWARVPVNFPIRVTAVFISLIR